MTSPQAPASSAWPADGLEGVSRCPVCGARDRAPLYSGLRDRAFGTAPGEWSLVRCKACASAFLDPRPTPDTIGLAYRSYYTHVDTASGPPPVNRIREGLGHEYQRVRWGYQHGDEIRGGHLLARLFRSRAAIADRSIRHLPSRPGGRLLDVGCGNGAFVARMSELGWRAEGIDPDAESVAAARAADLDVIEGMLEAIDDSDHAGQYDAVTLSHVIEHLHDPLGDLRRARRLLRPGGILWIATPNLESLGHRRFGAHWRGLEPPRHVVLFTRSSLEDQLRRAGFDPQPAPVASPRAWPMFRESAGLAQGLSIDQALDRGAWRIRALAAIADLLASRNGHHADELVAIAVRPDV